MRRFPLLIAVALVTFGLGILSFAAVNVWPAALGVGAARALRSEELPPVAELPLVAGVEIEAYSVYDTLLNGSRAVRDGDLILIRSQTEGYTAFEHPAGSTHYEHGRPFTDELKGQFRGIETSTIQNYLAGNEKEQTLGDFLQLTTTYVLTTDDQFKTLAWPDEEAYRHHRYFGFSVPGFNREHNQALVYIWSTCGGDCGGGSYVFLEKKNGCWQTVGWMGLWIA